MLYNDLINLFYPEACSGCSQALSKQEELLCWQCLADLPKTAYHQQRQNPVMNSFLGRCHLERAAAWLHFEKGGLVQSTMHQLKYRGQSAVGVELGCLAARDWQDSGFFSDVDFLIPVPLHRKKYRKRGYNQAEMIAKGISNVTKIPISTQHLQRVTHRGSQTLQSRFARWLNVRTVFELKGAQSLAHKHIMLVDDVITTGATLEACIQVMQSIPEARFSVFTLARAQ